MTAENSERRVRAFLDEATGSYSYVISSGKEAAIIDPVLGFDLTSACIDTVVADDIAQHIVDEGLSLRWLLETHVHADHLSASHYLREKLGGETCISRHLIDVRHALAKVINAGQATVGKEVEFARLLRGGEKLALGNDYIEVLATPGHTPACMTFLFDDAAFVGDTVFMPDCGTARTDFPGGDAKQLYQSVQSIFALGDSVAIYVCHDYPPPTRHVYRFKTSVAEQRQHNVHISDGVSESQFVARRLARDAGLARPRLFYSALKFNLRGGLVGDNPRYDLLEIAKS